MLIQSDHLRIIIISFFGGVAGRGELALHPFNDLVGVACHRKFADAESETGECHGWNYSQDPQTIRLNPIFAIFNINFIFSAFVTVIRSHLRILIIFICGLVSIAIFFFFIVAIVHDNCKSLIFVIAIIFGLFFFFLLLFQLLFSLLRVYRLRICAELFRDRMDVLGQ